MPLSITHTLGAFNFGACSLKVGVSTSDKASRSTLNSANSSGSLTSKRYGN
jgi:hypothetical protein